MSTHPSEQPAPVSGNRPQPAPRKVIDFRARPATLHEFFGGVPGSARYERVKGVNVRVGARDPEHFAGERDHHHFVQRMVDAGITMGILVSRNIPNCRVENDAVAAIVRAHPTRLVGVGAVDPAEGIRAAVKEVERCINALGLKGINMDPGLTKAQMAFDDRRCFPVYAACAELGVPVVLMTGPFSGPNIGYTHPVGIDQVGNAFPTLKIIAGHACWPYSGEMVGTAFRNPNIYISPDIYQFQPGGEDYLQGANTFLQDQYLFGTAYPFRPFKQTLDDFLALAWDPAVLDKVLYKNAARLFGLADD